MCAVWHALPGVGVLVDKRLDADSVGLHRLAETLTVVIILEVQPAQPMPMPMADVKQQVTRVYKTTVNTLAVCVNMA